MKKLDVHIVNTLWSQQKENEMSFEKIFVGERKEFKNIEDKKCAFIDFLQEGNDCFIKCWVYDGRDGDLLHKAVLKKLHINEIYGGVNELKRLDIWDSLTDEIKESYSQHQVVESKRIMEAEAVNGKSKKGRRKKYVGIPNEIECCRCGHREQIIPSVIGKKLEAKNILLEDFIAKFQCRLCNPPKRGRPKVK